MTRASAFERLFVPEPNTGCFLWTGSQASNGYGRFGHGGVRGIASRVSWELYRGPIPDGVCVCHRCDNPLCVNPDHLFLGTHADNTADKVRKGRQKGGAPRGSGNGRAKLDEMMVAEILARKAAGETHKTIAARYGVSRSLVSMIVTGKIWKHVGACA